jgi:hypothetical protein
MLSLSPDCGVCASMFEGNRVAHPAAKAPEIASRRETSFVLIPTRSNTNQCPFLTGPPRTIEAPNRGLQRVAYYAINLAQIILASAFYGSQQENFSIEKALWRRTSGSIRQAGATDSARSGEG